MASSTEQSFRVLAPFRTDEQSKAHTVPRRTKRSSACTACKARRSKCTGNQPCDKCNEAHTECVFAEALDRRRKYAQKRAEQDLVTAQQLLEKLVEAFSAGDIAQIGQLLSTVKRNGPQEEKSERSESSTAVKAFSHYRPRRKKSGSSSSSTSVGSLNDVGTLTEDPNRNAETRATGYIGKESEIAWMQKLDTEASNLDREWHQQTSSMENTVTPMSYHLDNLQIAEPFSAVGDPRVLPPKPWAARLFSIYFESIGPVFPLINKSLFTYQFNCAYTNSAQQPTRKWLAVLNLVLAIAAKYYQLAEPVSGQDVDDRIFLSRAIALTTTRWLAVQHADLHQVQIDLLLAIYYLVSGQINRSWQINGRAARSAVALGLNLREVSGQIDPVSKETRARMWWSIFHLEHLLSGMTGRSTCVDYRALSVYPPVPYDEVEFKTAEVEALLGDTALREERLKWTIYASKEDLQARSDWFRSLAPVQSLYFFHLVDLCVITHAAVAAIYSLTTTKDSGQSCIVHFQEKLQTWVASLQAPFSFTDKNNKLTVTRECRGQVSLALYYYSSQIILSRPCLTRPDVQEGSTIRFPRSRFGDDTARTCVDSAMGMISVFPDNPSMDWILKMTPWCSVLHFLMQALTILLIQLSIGPVQVMTSHGEQSGQGSDDTDEGPEAVLNASKKAIRWLHRMAEQDASSRRAFKICDSFIRRIAPAKEFDLSGVPSITSLPEHTSGYRSSHFERHDNQEGSGTVPSGIPENPVNWGPDCTIAETSADEQEQDPAALDPALFSWADVIEEEK
ncbi:hypothetical protein BJY04DRAFT_229179 [Aspergillus karnatakaensis]|uniref:uncharacterized protein n=1 Tax=Aspergillus karnatakaensis TaxID=1810916 RepID=UPI003CCD047A